MRKLLSMLLILCALSCGKKGDPEPKSNLDIPLPDQAVLIAEDGLYITNNSDIYPLIVERAVSEIGDLGMPMYAVLARVYPGDSFADRTTEYGVRYVYRFTNEHNRYAARSESVTQVVSYRGVVKVDSASWEFNEEQLCLNVQYSRSTAYVNVIINGHNMGTFSQASPCYELEAVSDILLVLIPYADSNTPGAAFSQNIKWAPEVLLPPSNIRIVRRGDKATLSWDAANNAKAYKISYPTGSQTTDATLITLDAPAACVQYRISSINDEAQSRELVAESCP